MKEMDYLRQEIDGIDHFFYLSFITVLKSCRK